VTVSKWRNRFAEGRLDGLVDAPRPGAARTIGDDVIEAIVVETLESAPPDATHWSTRSLAAKHGISHTTVREIWQAFGLKPWREDSFKVSPDPDLVEKGPRPGRALHEPAGGGRGVRRRRKTPDPGAQPHRTDLAHVAHDPGPGHPRL
jgi:transposase